MPFHVYFVIRELQINPDTCLAASRMLRMAPNIGLVLDPFSSKYTLHSSWADLWADLLPKFKFGPKISENGIVWHPSLRGGAGARDAPIRPRAERATQQRSCGLEHQRGYCIHSTR